MKRKNLLIPLLLMLFMVSYITEIHSQTRPPEPFYYLSPLPGAKMVRPESGIILKTRAEILPEKLSSGISIQGSTSGKIDFELKVLREENAILIRPVAHFKYNEKVSVSISNSIFKTPLSDEPVQYAFFTMKQPVEVKYMPEELRRENSQARTDHNISDSLKTEYNLPADFPAYEITQKENPCPGYFFLTPLKWEDAALYVIIMDNHGFPVFYRKNPAGCYDFKLQPNGELTYYEASCQKFIRLNSRLDETGFYAMANGYSTDLHECNITEEGHVWMLGYDPQLVDMDTVVEGGQPGAVVTGLIVQEQDSNGNVLFQWRSWDHFQITDASEWVNLTAETIDYVHGNTIEIMDENSILISCRNMNEITKINRTTGEIIWRMGGQACHNNMFTFVNDSLQFRMQHDIRYHGGNLVSLYNNSNGSDPDPYSSSIFYMLNEENFTAKEDERYYNDPPVFGDIMGNCQKLENGNLVTGWGRPDNHIVTTEFCPDGEEQIQISIPYTVYRSFKFVWENDVFTKSTDTLDYSIYYPDSAIEQVTIGNNHSREISVNGFHNHTDVFDLVNKSFIPATLAPGDSVTFSVKFIPPAAGNYTDVLSFYEDIENEEVVQRTGCQLKMIGVAMDDESIHETALSAVRVSPNPAKGIFKITVSKSYLPLNLEVSSASGAVVKRQKQFNRSELNVNLNRYPDGIYFLKASQPGSLKSQVIKLMKLTP